MLLLEGTSQFGPQDQGEQPRVGGPGPTQGDSSFHVGGGQPRFLTHQQAREQILGIAQPSGQTTMGAPQAPYANRLGSTLEGRGESLRQDIQGAGESFREQMGSADPYDQGALERAISPGTAPRDREGATESAKRQLDTSYSGPTGLAPDVVASIAGRLQDYEQEARSLQTGGGLAGAVKRQSPGMTQGEALFEAETTLRDNPGYRDTLIPQIQEAAGLRGALGNESRMAGEAAQERVAQEKQIAQQAREYLSGQKQGVYERLQGEVEAKNREQEALKALYDKTVADPSQENLAALDPYTDADLSALGAPAQASAEAKAAYADVMRRYAEAFPEIAAYPPLQRIATKRGETWYAMPGPEGELTDIRKLPGMTKETEKHLVARQRELEGLFEPRSPKRKGKKEEGEYANLAPLYYGEGGADPLENVYQAPDVADILSLEEGNSPTMEMLASSDDRLLVDNVNALLGEADRLAETGEVFRAAMISADVNEYLGRVEQEMAAREAQWDQADKEFFKRVREARNRYRKSRAAKSLASVGSVLVGYPAGTGLTGTPDRAIAGGFQRVI